MTLSAGRAHNFVLFTHQPGVTPIAKTRQVARSLSKATLLHNLHVLPGGLLQPSKDGRISAYLILAARRPCVRHAATDRQLNAAHYQICSHRILPDLIVLGMIGRDALYLDECEDYM